jgi:hypothetical protein
VTAVVRCSPFACGADKAQRLGLLLEAFPLPIRAVLDAVRSVLRTGPDRLAGHDKAPSLPGRSHRSSASQDRCSVDSTWSATTPPAGSSSSARTPCCRIQT